MLNLFKQVFEHTGLYKWVKLNEYYKNPKIENKTIVLFLELHGGIITDFSNRTSNSINYFEKVEIPNSIEYLKKVTISLFGKSAYSLKSYRPNNNNNNTENKRKKIFKNFLCRSIHNIRELLSTISKFHDLFDSKSGNIKSITDKDIKHIIYNLISFDSKNNSKKNNSEMNKKTYSNFRINTFSNFSNFKKHHKYVLSGNINNPAYNTENQHILLNKKYSYSNYDLVTCPNINGVHILFDSGGFLSDFERIPDALLYGNNIMYNHRSDLSKELCTIYDALTNKRYSRRDLDKELIFKQDFQMSFTTQSLLDLLTSIGYTNIMLIDNSCSSLGINTTEPLSNENSILFNKLNRNISSRIGKNIFI